MSKKKTIITLIIIALVGSLMAFFASNCFFDDVANHASNMTIIATIPALMVGAMFVTATLYVVRLYKRPKTIKRLSRTYLFVMIGLALVALVTTILAGVIVYECSFLKPYPFPGYLIIMLIFNILIIGCAFFLLFKFVFKMKDDEEQYKVKVGHVFHTIGLFLLISLAYNRFGGLLLSPLFIQWRTLYMTFVMYLYLLIPMALLVIKAISILFPDKKLLIPAIAVGVCNIALAVAIIIIGKSDTAFISGVSQVMPLERLAAMPVEIIIHFLTYLGVSIYYVIAAIKNRHPKEENNEQQ